MRGQASEAVDNARLPLVALGRGPRDARPGRHAGLRGHLADVEALLDSIEAGGASARTVNEARNLVGAVFAYGVRMRGLQSNPARATDKRREGQRPTLETCTADEVERLAEATGEPQDAAIVRVAAYAGLRMGELLALRWKDVDDDVLTVSRSVSNGEVTGTKRGRARHVPNGLANLELVRSIIEAMCRGDFQPTDWGDPQMEFRSGRRARGRRLDRGCCGGYS